MTWMRQRRWRRPVDAALLLLLVGGGPLACGVLDVTDPTAILDEDVNDADGAELLARAAVASFYRRVDLAAWETGLLADEFLFQQSALTDQRGLTDVREQIDRRDPLPPYLYASPSAISAASYGFWQTLRMRETGPALAKLRAYGRPGAREARLGELLAIRGYAALHLAEQYCPGFPLHEVVEYQMVYGPPRSTEQVFEYALANFDSAASWAADSARVLHFARVGRARALLNLGRFAEAAAAVRDVPTEYAYRTEYNAAGSPRNQLASVLGSPNFWGVERSVADRQGGTGLDFVSARDPRVPTKQLGTARDTTTKLYGTTKYPTLATPIVAASGIEARLIEAEAALRADQPEWLTLLNTLRTNGTPNPDGSYQAGTGGVAGLAPLADPGSDAARQDLLFRERAFWLFGTAHRLGDLRRLMRQYGRSRESVFPSGPYWRGGSHGAATSFAFPQSEQTFSPGVTGCTGE